MGAVLKRAVKGGWLGEPTTDVGLGDWNDLSGLLLPATEEQRIIDDIKNGTLETVHDVNNRFREINDHFREYQWTWSYRMILDYYQLDELTDDAIERIHQDYIKARRAWIAEIRKDAAKEYEMGDVEEDVYMNFLEQLDHEVDYED
jgi:hypothetical protein